MSTQLGVVVLVSSNVAWAALVNVLNVAAGIGLTHGYRGFVQWRNWPRLPPTRLAPRVAAATLVLSAGYVASSSLIALALSPVSPFGPVRLSTYAFVNTTVQTAPVLLLWSVIYFGIHYFWRLRSAAADRLQLAVQTRDAKLEALRLQLNPHFLFNSLNSVRSLVSEAPSEARTMITRIARLLRSTLETSDSLTVSLRDDLDLARTYLQVEAVRLEDRLAYTIEADDGVRSHPVPPMLVQTLVENAIKHGVSQQIDGGRVDVAAQEVNGALRVRVTNTGELNAAGGSTGTGLRNLRERLHILFGDDASLTLRAGPSDTVVAEALVPHVDPSELPLRPAAAEAPDDPASGAHRLDAHLDLPASIARAS
jgi:signal transduction histidine kinase